MAGRASIVSLLLLVSGMCALVLQTAWLRELRLIFGASTPASAAVLAIFMGGMGLGNALLGWRADASPNPLRLYSRLEMAISATSMISPIVVWLVRAIYIAIGGQESLGLLGATLLRVVFAALVMGPATFLMGGTLPAAVKAVTSSDDVSRRAVGRLYGLNSLGAVLGALLSTFFLLEVLGTRATLWAACAVNLLNSLAAWKLSQWWGPEPAVPPVPSEPAAPGGVTPPAVSPFGLYLVAGIVGCAFFLMELVWYRMLGPILGGTTFTFGMILAVALAGIGVGGAIYPLIFRHRPPDLRSLALTLGFEALAIAVPFALGDRLAIIAAALRPLSSLGFNGQVFGWLVITNIVVFPAALISGIQFPVLIALLGQGSRHVGKQVGHAFASNTVGAVIGSLAGGFGLVTLLTATGVWKLVAAGLAVCAIALVLSEFGRRRQFGRLLVPLGVTAAVGICLSATGPTAVWRHSGIGAGRAQVPMSAPNDLKAWMNTQRRDIIWQADGLESSVAISAARGIGFVVNGKSDGNAVNDAGTQVMLGVLGVLLHGRPRDGLVIGLGTGESAGWLAHQPTIERVDVVEIEPAIGHVADVCGPMNHDVLRQPKVHIIFNDARETLLTTRHKYDLIASEPSNPYRSGVSSLYTREFYLAAHDRLQPGGVLLQWLQGYEIDIPTVRTVLCTLCDVFRYVEIWETNPADLVLVCSSEPLSYTAADLSARLREPPMRDALRVAWRTATLEGVVAHLIATDRFAQAVAAQKSGQINTDDQNLLEYRFARAVGLSGGFSVSGLRTEAAGAQLQRLPRLEGEVDWEAVEDARIAYHAAAGDAPLSSAMFAGARARRAEYLLAFQTRPDLAAAVRLWQSQPKPPRDLTEILAVGLGLADQGDEQALELVEPIRTVCPIEADVIAGALATRQHRPDQAAQTLARLFAALRRDPTPMPTIVEHAIRAALEVAEQDPRQIPLLYESLRQPFSLLVAQDRRITALCLLGQRLGPRELADAVSMLEPYPNWEARMLELRAMAYEQTGHPALARARRELGEFQAHAPEAAVLMPN